MQGIPSPTSYCFTFSDPAIDKKKKKYFSISNMPLNKYIYYDKIILTHIPFPELQLIRTVDAPEIDLK